MIDANHKFRLRTLQIALLCCAATCAARAHAQEEPRLIEQDPFDQITLDANNDNAVFKVAPLDLPGRRVPAKPPAGESLRIRLLDKPDKQYDVLWTSIAEVKLYEQMLFDEAQQLTTEQKFAEAFDNYAYLTREHPNLPGLKAAVEQYLLSNAVSSFKEQDFPAAYVQLLELHRRNPKHAAVAKALSAVADKLVTSYVRAEKYASARAVLDVLSERFSETEQAFVKQWQQRFVSRATQLAKQAQTEFDAKRYAPARRLNREALEVWPTLAPAIKLAEEINKQAPQVIVGVSRVGGRLTSRLDDWASLRSRRLVNRPLSELVGFGAEGGIYQCPLGVFETDPLKPQFAIQLRAGTPWSAEDGTITGYDVSRRLLALAQSDQPGFRPDWAELFEAVAVQDVYRVTVELRQPHPRPQAMLQVPLFSNYGPYVVENAEAGQVRYTTSPYLTGDADDGPQEIIEQPFRSDEAALEALGKGDITVLDRIPPWQLAVVRSNPDLVVERYALPLVHVLIPHPSKPLVNNRTFRRALTYGIHREMILQQELLAGQQLEGAAVLSGPFPVRTTLDDPLGFASNERIKPRPYEPRLALALALSAAKEEAARAKAAKATDGDETAKADEESADEGLNTTDDEAADPLPNIPTLILAHPDEPLAHAACQAIQSHLGRANIPVQLRVWNPDDPAASMDEYDLLYAQLAMWDPLVDARRLLGEAQMVGGVNPYLNLALRKLDLARDSTEIRDRLYEIHQLVFEDVTVVPLWQLPEHFAYQRTLSEVGEQPVTLYQNVERWQVGLQLPSNP